MAKNGKGAKAQTKEIEVSNPTIAPDQNVEVPPQEAPAPETPKDVPAADAKAKVPAKMEQILSDDGDTLTFRFRADPDPIDPIVAKLSEFPENVRNFFAYFGMRTKLRNFTVPDADEAEASPSKMHAKLATGIALLKAGTLRVVREAGEKKGGGTLLLEAAIFYRQRKHAILVEGAKAKGEEVAPYAETPEDVAKALEALSDEQVEQLKGTALFQLAMQDAKDARASAKRKALEAKVAAEASASPL